MMCFEFLGWVEIMDRYIRETVAVCDAVAAKRKSSKRIMLCFDEWNVWYKARSGEHMAKPGWPVAPPLIEEIYDLQDALMVGGALITLLNNADRVKVACQAQLVNVIGLIFAEAGGAAWRQTIFHPFKIVTEHAHGSVLEAKVSLTSTKQKPPELPITSSLRPSTMQPKTKSSSSSLIAKLTLWKCPSTCAGSRRLPAAPLSRSRVRIFLRPIPPKCRTTSARSNTTNSPSRPTKLSQNCLQCRGICSRSLISHSVNLKHNPQHLYEKTLLTRGRMPCCA